MSSEQRSEERSEDDRMSDEERIKAELLADFAEFSERFRFGKFDRSAALDQFREQVEEMTGPTSSSGTSKRRATLMGSTRSERMRRGTSRKTSDDHHRLAVKLG